MLRWALLALLAVPLLDMLLLLVVADAIGPVPTVALVVLTGLIGLLLVRAEGRHAIRRLQEKVVRGELPTDELLDGGLLIAAGAFLLTPGLVTDAVGLVLVLPPTRYPIRMGLKRWVVVPALDSRTGGFATGKVYTFGFPDQGNDGGRDDAYDLGPDAYDVDVEGGKDGENGNA